MWGSIAPLIGRTPRKVRSALSSGDFRFEKSRARRFSTTCRRLRFEFCGPSSGHDCNVVPASGRAVSQSAMKEVCWKAYVNNWTIYQVPPGQEARLPASVPRVQRSRPSSSPVAASLDSYGRSIAFPR
ncbi:hypothetical protein KM043_016984 [Ampulex compressa]|nr:hypothetical protein KM043_016984 [Ampulex compressa]